MFGDIKAFYDMAVDKSQSLGTRVATVITIVALIFIFDCVTNFTYNIFISNKLSNLEAVNNLKTIYQSDSIHFKELLKIEKNLLERKHYFVDRIFFKPSMIDFMSRSTPATNDTRADSISRNTPKVNGTDNTTNFNTTKNISSETIRSNFWMVLSSSYLFVLTLFIFFFAPVFTKEKRSLRFFIGWFASLVILILIIAFITWTAYQIPIINNNPLWNYIINFLIHTFLIMVIVKMLPKSR